MGQQHYQMGQAGVTARMSHRGWAPLRCTSVLYSTMDIVPALLSSHRLFKRQTPTTKPDAMIRRNACWEGFTDACTIMAGLEAELVDQDGAEAPWAEQWASKNGVLPFPIWRGSPQLTFPGETTEGGPIRQGGLSPLGTLWWQTPLPFGLSLPWAAQDSGLLFHPKSTALGFPSDPLAFRIWQPEY